MDLLDEVQRVAGIDPEVIFEIRAEYGGENHYIRSVRSDRHRLIRAAVGRCDDVAKAFGVTSRTVRNVRRAGLTGGF